MEENKKKVHKHHIHNPDHYYIQKKQKSHTPEKKALLEEKNDDEIKKTFFKTKNSDLLKLIGQDKNYQKGIFVSICFLNFFLSFIFYSISYLYYTPEYMCYDSQGRLFQCKSEEACSNDFGYEIKSDRESLVTKYKLYCQDELKHSNSLFVIFTTAAIIGFLYTMLSDFLGRSFILKLNCFFILVGAVILIFGENFDLITIGIALFFSYYDVFFSTIYIWINESMGNNLRNYSLGVSFFFFGMGNFAFLFINVFFTDYRQILNIIVIVTCAGLVFFLFFKETIFFYSRNKNIKNLYHCMLKIASINYEKDLNKEIDISIKKQLGLENINIENYEVFRIRKITKFKKNGIKNFFVKMQGYWIHFFCCVVVYCIPFFCSGMFSISPQYLGLDNMYINIFVLNFAELFGYFVMAKRAKNIPRKKMIQSLFIIFYFSSIALFSFTFFKIRELFITKLFETIISFIIRIFLCMTYTLLFNYVNELFPTKIRGFVMGFCILTGRLNSSFISYITMFCLHHDLHPLTFAGIFGIVGNFALCFLPETVRNTMKN
jgi:MFS family permease